MSIATAGSRTVRQSAGRARFWIVLGLILVAVVAAVLVIQGGARSGGTPLAADNPAPKGAKAVVQVLRKHGVRVHIARSLRSAVADLDGATLLLYDPNGYLDDAQLRRLGARATKTVLVEPRFSMLRVLAPHVLLAGAAQHHGPFTANCGDAAAQRAGSISTTSSAYRSADATQTACFPTGGGAYAMVTAADGRVTVLGSHALFANESIIDRGNAALALGVLGTRSDLVWYLPTQADVAASGPPSLAQLTPGWVTAAVLLLIAVFVAAAVWRGRRFGPLVIENLPVVVRAEETMEGRSRLYQRSSARLHALDALRIGAIGRLAILAGLPESSPVDAVTAAAADLSGRPPDQVREILLDAAPRSDGDLMRLSRELKRLEAEVRSATRAAGGAASDHRTGE